MTRGRRTSKSNTQSEPAPPAATKSSQKVLIIKDIAATDKRLECIELKHPRTESAALFLLSETQLYELNTFDEGHRSWFLGSTVICDGRLHIATPYNPTYLILPYLMQAERNVPLDQLLEDQHFPSMVRVAGLASDSLQAVADRKGTADLNVWKYNEEKTLSWLERRCRQLAETLMEKKVPTTTAQALTFVRTMDQQQTKEAYLVLAHGILSEYLPEKLSVSLRKALKLPENSRLKQKATTEAKNQPQPKKAKLEGPTEDYSASSPPVRKDSTPTSAKARALAKNAVGNKSIMSFFGKK